MFRAVNRPAICYDLVGLASFGLVTVGREPCAALRLDCPEIPFLLSRKHATLQLQPNGKFLLKDLGSTNGTYCCRPGQTLRKLTTEARWELEEGDTISLGGPEVIMARGEHVANPFIFKFYLSYDDTLATENQPDSARSVSMLEHQPTMEHLPVRPEQQAFAAAALRQSSLVDGPDLGYADQEPARQEHSKSPLQQQKRSHSTPEPYSSSNVMTSILATHLSCPICHDWLVACHTLTCGHMFCGLCLATWLNQNQTCPSCRKSVAGVPVRCFQVDSTINDLLDQGVNVMSPPTKKERRQKQDHWEHVQESVVPDWALSLHTRQHKAVEAAARNDRGYNMVRAVGSSHRLSEHGSGPARRA